MPCGQRALMPERQNFWPLPLVLPALPLSMWQSALMHSPRGPGEKIGAICDFFQSVSDRFKGDTYAEQTLGGSDQHFISAEYFPKIILIKN